MHTAAQLGVYSFIMHTWYWMCKFLILYRPPPPKRVHARLLAANPILTCHTHPPRHGFT